MTKCGDSERDSGRERAQPNGYLHLAKWFLMCYVTTLRTNRYLENFQHNEAPSKGVRRAYLIKYTHKYTLHNSVIPNLYIY